MITFGFARRLTGFVRRRFGAVPGGSKPAPATIGNEAPQRGRVHPDPGSIEAPVAVIGPATRWNEVAPEGSLPFDRSVPAVTAPGTIPIAGPSPRLVCRFSGEDVGEAVDIIVAAKAKAGEVYFRLKLGRLRDVDLAAVGISLPAGDARLWAVRKSALDGRLAISRRTDLRVDPAWPNAVRHIATVQAQSAVAAESSAMPAAPGEPADGARETHLAVWSRNIDSASGSPADPKFLFGPLGARIDLLRMRSDLQGVYPNAFTAAWLGTLLAEREIRTTLIERAGNGVNGGQAMAEALGKWLPGRAVHLIDTRWIWLDRSEDLADRVASLPTAYPFLHRAYDGFRELMPDHSRDQIASRSFMYSMLGATRNSLMLERISARLGWGPRPAMADIGGGYGFLGLELAAKGWNVAVVDNSAARTERIGPWLAQRSPRSLSIDFFTLSMDDIPEVGVPGAPAPQAIIFIHSLLMAGRERVADILRACWDRLAPGGAIIIHELVRETPGENPLDRRLFETEELVRLVTENTAAPSYVSILDGEPMRKFVAGMSVVIARKPDASGRRLA